MTTRRWAMTLVVILGGVSCGGAEAGDSGERDSAPAAEAAGVDAAAASGSGVVEIVAADVLPADENQTFPAEDPVTGDLWFSVIRTSFDDQTIMRSARTASGWSAPEAAPFSGEWGDRAPRFTPDGSALLFTSNRPRPGGGQGGDMNVWRVERAADGAWGEPEILAGPVNSDAPDIHPSVSASAIWVASGRDGGMGRSDLYRVGHDGEVRHLPAPLNSELSQPDLWISPDEDWMILAITDHPSGLGGDDLYVSRSADGVWSEPLNLGPEINTAEYEYGPWVTADGRWLLFTSHRDGASNVYRVPMSMVRTVLDRAGG